ncbi:ATP-binding cassette domain-containing protein [Microlunatus sp. GCM10028923]|uniref:ATP-binding cassette domain-containing protein n=1 Tax=Microlunatus sp. GCM10028923 TaxID=3273400 RepID=UPI0036210A3F
MIGNLAALRLLIGTAWRVARRDLLRSLLETTASLSRGVTPWLVAGVVAGIDQHRQDWLIMALIGMLLCVFADWVLRALGATAHVAMAEKVSFAFERDIARAVATRPTLDHFDDPEFADTLQMLTQNQGRIGGGMSGLVHAADVAAKAAIVIIIATLVEPRLLLLAVAVVPALAAARLRLRWTQRGEDESAAAGRLVAHCRQVVTDPALGMELRVFGLRRTIAGRLQTAVDRWQRPRLRATQRNAFLGVGEEALSTLIVGATLLWLLFALADGDATPAVMVAAVVAARQIQQSLLALIGEGSGIAETLQYVQRADALNRTARTTNEPGASTFTQTGIRLVDVSFRYRGATQSALQHINLNLVPGQVVAIVGENGAGKTTLVELLLGLYRPTAGTIEGTTRNDHSTATFQDFTRPELTAREAIGLGDPRMINNTAHIEGAAHAGGAGFVTDLAEGLSTQLGASWPGGTDLSGGQWQRVALARGSMRRNPYLTVLDEPTAALDAHAEHEIFTRYAAAAATTRQDGGITILVTHRFSTVKDADTILVLHQGRLIEQGSHSDLINRAGHYARLYRMQQDGYLSDPRRHR